MESPHPSVCPSVCVSHFVWTMSPEPLNRFKPNLVWWCILTRWCVIQKNWFNIFNVKVTLRGYIIKIWLFLRYLLNCRSVCNQTWFVSAASEAKSVLWKNWVTAFKVKVTAKVQNVSECLSKWYLLNCWTFYNQIWHDDASSWARLSYKKIGLLSYKKIGKLSLRSRSQWRIITIIKIWHSNISSGLLILLQLNMVWWHIIIRWIVLWKDWVSLLW